MFHAVELPATAWYAWAKWAVWSFSSWIVRDVYSRLDSYSLSKSWFSIRISNVLRVGPRPQAVVGLVMAVRLLWHVSCEFVSDKTLFDTHLPVRSLIASFLPVYCYINLRVWMILTMPNCRMFGGVSMAWSQRIQKRHWCWIGIEWLFCIRWLHAIDTS